MDPLALVSINILFVGLVCWYFRAYIWFKFNCFNCGGHTNQTTRIASL